MFKSTSKAPSTQDALEEYLASGPTAAINDPIAYWDLHMKSYSSDPGAVALGQMAMNFLTVPGMSAPFLHCG